MNLKPQLAADTEARATGTDAGLTVDRADLFVINLCSSTTPMALAQPDAPELKRFRFFVSRRLEDRRERFRLHMGYFTSLEEAEDWLSVVRDVYPGAWAGEAPGRRLRARAASLTAAPAVSTPAAALAAAATPAAPIIAPALAPTTTPAIEKSKDALLPPAPPAPRTSSQPQEIAVSRARQAPLAPLSNVREVLAALDDGDAKAAVVHEPAAKRPPALSDTQLMQMLEARSSPARARGEPGAAARPAIALLRPEDTGTRRALHAAVQGNAPISFAVQLQWSVQPLALDKVPPLAIFSAYTLYTVEGSREGRKWFGLRLGFFSDADAAKQVAHYVRSEFTSVAVLPVSSQERTRATQSEDRVELAGLQPARSAPEAPEIELLEEKVPAPVERRAPGSPMRAPAKLPAGSAHSASPAARAAAQRSKQLRGKERKPRSPAQSLEETLEILGAGDLEIDKGRGELINQGRVRHLAVELRKDSPFARLVARLTERVHRS